MNAFVSVDRIESAPGNSEMCIQFMHAAVRARPPEIFVRPEDLNFDFIRFCDFHHVIPLIADGVRQTAAVQTEFASVLPFLEEFELYAIDRNAAVMKELDEVLATLEGVILPPMILKGVANLIEGNLKANTWRFVDDIDILVSPDDLQAAVYTLAYIGYKTSAENYNATDDHHYPMLSKSGARAGIKLHTRLAAQPAGDILPVNEISARAVPVTVNGREAFIPSPEDRLMHLIVDGMICAHRFQHPQIILREAIDYLNLVTHHDLPLSLMHEHFTHHDHAAECEAFVCCMSLIWGNLAPYPAWCVGQEKWVDDVFTRMESPAKLRRDMFPNWCQLLGHELTSRDGLGRLFRTIRSAERRRFFTMNKMQVSPELK